MSKNNPLRKMTPDNRNYKMYKAKKQWVTACATFLIAMGATAVSTTVSHADTTANNDDNNTPAEEQTTSDKSKISAAPSSQLKLSNDNSQSDSNSSVGSSHSETAPSNTANQQVVQGTTSSDQTGSSNAKHYQFSEEQNDKNQDSQSIDQSQSSVIKLNSTDAKSGATNVDTLKQSLEAKPVAESLDETSNPTPIAYDNDNSDNSGTAYVLVGQDLSNKAADFLENAKELEDAGAIISWDGAAPNVTTGGDDEYSGKIKVTYKDGTSTTVTTTFYGMSKIGLNASATHEYLYINNVGDSVDITKADANGTTVSAGDNSTSLLNNGDGQGANYSFSFDTPIDTSQEGLHWANLTVHETDTFAISGQQVLGGNTYTVKIPYIVKDLVEKEDNPKDSAGDIVINAQKSTFIMGNGDKGQYFPEYFYQDYLQAYALGVRANVSDWTGVAYTGISNNTVGTNHDTGDSFNLSFEGLPNDNSSQSFKVFYVKETTKGNTIYIFNSVKNKPNAYIFGRPNNWITLRKSIADGVLNSTINVQDKNGKNINPSSAHVDQLRIVTGYQASDGQYELDYSAIFDKTDAQGRPLLWSDETVPAEGSEQGGGLAEGLIAQLQTAYQKANKTTKLISGANYLPTQAPQWNMSSKVIVLFQPIANTKPVPVDITDIKGGQYTPTTANLKDSVKNPTGEKLGNSTANPLPGATKKADGTYNDDGTWPNGTTFEFVDNSGNPITFDKAGEVKTGNIKATLNGSSCTVEDITLVSHANPTVENKTVSYGTKLTAADLVTNKDAFPEGTTFSFVDNSEPDWTKSGQYNHVKIQATYSATVPKVDKDGNIVKDSSGNVETERKSITSDAVTVNIAINDAKIINVLQGATIPSADDVIGLSTDTSKWPAHTISWERIAPNSNSTNAAKAKIHYTASGLDQTITIDVNVIPKVTVKTPQLKTDGSLFTGTGNLYNSDGTVNDATLINNVADGVTYKQFTSTTDKQGDQSTFSESPADTTDHPAYTISGLQYIKDKDGQDTKTLVSGIQNITVKVSVPDGTIGATKSDDGKYYYTETGKIEVAQPVNFRYIDADTNQQVTGTTTSTQEFLKGQSATITATESANLPKGYGLASGQSSTYTLANYSTATPTVDIKVMQVAQYQTRTVTADHIAALPAGQTVTINGKTYHNGDSLGSSVLDVYYVRNRNKDTSGNYLNTWGDWTLDTSVNSSTTAGYKVESGVWTPTINGGVTGSDHNQTYQDVTTSTISGESNLANRPPQIAGFTPIERTYGDYRSWVWASPTNRRNTAYTDNYLNGYAGYEDAPVHYIYYVPSTIKTQTVTVHYKDTNGNMVHADDVINVPYIQKDNFTLPTNAKTDTSQWNNGQYTVTADSTWNWDSNANYYKGYTVKSGNSKWTTSADGLTVTLPAVTDYTTTKTTLLVKPNGEDQEATVTYTGNENATVTFVDDDSKESSGNAKQVGTSTTLYGVKNEKVKIAKPDSLANYELADGQSLNYTFTSAKNQTVTIHLKHKTAAINGADSSTWQGKDKTWIESHGLLKEVTQTINYVAGSKGGSSLVTAAQQAQIPANQTRTVEYYKTAKVDLVTNELVDGTISKDWAVNGTSSYAAETPKQISGLTAMVNWKDSGMTQTYESQIPAFAPKSTDSDSTVTVTYDVVYRINVYDDDKGSNL